MIKRTCLAPEILHVQDGMAVDHNLILNEVPHCFSAPNILYFATMMIRLFNFLAASSVERCYSVHFFPQAILPDHELWPLNFYLTVAKGVEVPGPVLLSVFTLHPLTAVHLASESESLRWTALPTPPPSFSSPFSLEIHIYVCTFCLDIDTPSSTGQEWL